MYCCDEMKNKIEISCDIHSNKFDCPDNIIYHSLNSNRYGIIVHDGGNSYIKINYCPWCGKKLTSS